MTSQLSATDLMLIRGERCLFEGVGFALEPEQLMLLEGKNGSGKTSLLRGLAGMLEFEDGEIRWGGDPVRNIRPEYLESLVWMGHKVGFKGDLTLVENLRFEFSLRPHAVIELDAILERLSIDRLKKLPVRALSAGQQRRVALARMLLSGGSLWLMDEPFTNLDRGGRELVEDIVRDHLAGGGMCVMAAHQDVSLDAHVERLMLS